MCPSCVPGLPVCQASRRSSEASEPDSVLSSAGRRERRSGEMVCSALKHDDQRALAVPELFCLWPVENSAPSYGSPRRPRTRARAAARRRMRHTSRGGDLPDSGEADHELLPDAWATFHPGGHGSRGDARGARRGSWRGECLGHREKVRLHHAPPSGMAGLRAPAARRPRSGRPPLSSRSTRSPTGSARAGGWWSTEDGDGDCAVTGCLARPSGGHL